MRRNVLACSATLAFLIPADALAATFFVDPTAPGADDGSSWADAFADLQSALALATNGDEIRVAGGTYVPGPTRSDTFRLPSGVVTRGSFGGYSSPEPDARDFDATPSILSGEIGDPTRDDNCYSVVDASGTAAGTTLDGFVVTRGHAWGGGTERGGGLYTNLGSPTLRDVRFVDNVSRWHGAGIFCDNGTITLERVEIADGAAGQGSNGNGGGMFADASDAFLTDCSILDNSAIAGAGGLFFSGGTLTLERCVFERNTARSGGALWLGGGDATLLDTEFRYNNAENDGGGVWTSNTSPVRLVNCLFWRNYTLGSSGGSVGGAVYFGGFGSANVEEITNCTFAENEAGSGGAIYIFNSGVPQITNSVFWGNYAEFSAPEISSGAELSHCIVAGSGGSGSWNPAFGTDGGGNLDADPGFVFMVLGDLHVAPESPAVDAGDPAAPNLADHDLDGNPRVLGATVDIGAYEIVPSPVASPAIANGSARLLRSVRPNPARGELRINLELRRSSDVVLDIYDVQGRLVRRLASGTMNEGAHRVTWNTEGVGGPVAAGTYFVRLRGEGVTESRKVVVLR